jgi:hypothetical protein
LPGAVLAVGGLDQLLLAAVDDQEAVGGQVAEVAGGQPAVPERLGHAGVHVTQGHLRAADQDLAVCGDAHHGLRQRLADGADPVASGCPDVPGHDQHAVADRVGQLGPVPPGPQQQVAGRRLVRRLDQRHQVVVGPLQQPAGHLGA